MSPTPQSPFLAQAFSAWNWKCALLSATARSLVYLAAMARTGMRGAGAVILVEIGYVSLTAGLYAGLQQRALRLRSRALGNLIVVAGVPLLAQWMDWTAHRLCSAAVAGKATAMVCIFAVISALFHLHAMRNGVFLTGHGRSLFEDFRRIPRLVAEFLLRPLALLVTLTEHLADEAES